MTTISREEEILYKNFITLHPDSETGIDEFFQELMSDPESKKMVEIELNSMRQFAAEEKKKEAIAFAEWLDCETEEWEPFLNDKTYTIAELYDLFDKERSGG